MLFGCLFCQLGLGFSYVFTTFLKPVTADMGWTREAFAWFGGPLLLSMALANPVIGQLTDRFGPRAVLTSGALLLGGTLALFGSMQSLWHFYATSLLFGIALTCLGDIPVGAVASRWFAHGRGLALGFIYTGSNIGGSIVPIVATAIAAGASWRTALFWLAGAAVWTIVPFALFVVRMPRGDAAAAAPPGEIDEEEEGLDLRAAVRTRTFWILAVALFVFYFYYIGVLQNLVAFLSDIGYSDPKAARRFGGAVAMGIAGKLAMGLLADRFPRKTILLATFGLVTLSSLLLFRVDDPTILLLFLGVFGFAVAAENVLLPLIVAEAFGVKHMAQIYGALMFTLLPGGALGPPFAARMYDTLGSYDVAFTAFAWLNVGTFALLCFVKRHSSVAGERPAADPRPEA